MYVETIKNRSFPPATLLRESFRENGKVKKHTLANLSYRLRDKVDALSAVLLNRLRLPPVAIEAGCRWLTASASEQRQRQIFVSYLAPVAPWPCQSRLRNPFKPRDRHNHRRWRERDLVVGMIVARLRFPRSKRDTTIRGETTAAWSKYWALRMPMKTRSMPLWIGSLGANKDSRNNSQIDTSATVQACFMIGALKSDAIRSLIGKGNRQTSLWDQKNPAEISGDAYPGERLIACFNPDMAGQRHRRRQELLHATEKALNQVVARSATANQEAPVGVRHRSESR